MLEEKDKFKTLFSKEQIQDRVKEMGEQISKKFTLDEQMTAVCILKGSFLFYADLIRHIDRDICCDFISVSEALSLDDSHENASLSLDLSNSVHERHILLVTDIVVTGKTLEYLKNMLLLRKPKSITTVALLLKANRLQTKSQIDHIGFEIQDQCVVGYGLEYKGYFRNLPYIAQIESFN